MSDITYQKGVLLVNDENNKTYPFFPVTKGTTIIWDTSDDTNTALEYYKKILEYIDGLTKGEDSAESLTSPELNMSITVDDWYCLLHGDNTIDMYYSVPLTSLTFSNGGENSYNAYQGDIQLDPPFTIIEDNTVNLQLTVRGEGPSEYLPSLICTGYYHDLRLAIFVGSYIYTITDEVTSGTTWKSATVDIHLHGTLITKTT